MRKKSCTHLNLLIQPMTISYLARNEDIVTDESSSTIVDPFIVDNQFKLPVVIKTNVAEAPPTILLFNSLVLLMPL